MKTSDDAQSGAPFGPDRKFGDVFTTAVKLGYS